MRSTHAEPPQVTPLIEQQLELVSGGLPRAIVGPSGSVYYMDGGSIAGVDDASTGTCYP